jgi:heme oxygenase
VAAFPHNGQVDISRLRSETASDHAAVENTMPLLGDGLNREAYAKILTRLHPIVSAWETHLPLHPQRPNVAFVMERSRLTLLERDLDALNAGCNEPASCNLPDFPNRAQLLGAMYVMEGSRLGGQIIARHVEDVLHLTFGEGTAYFRGFGDGTGPMWKEFINYLNTEVPNDQTDEVIVGAKKMFAAFGTWMHNL